MVNLGQFDSKYPKDFNSTMRKIKSVNYLCGTKTRQPFLQYQHILHERIESISLHEDFQKKKHYNISIYHFRTLIYAIIDGIIIITRTFRRFFFFCALSFLFSLIFSSIYFMFISLYT